MNDFRESHRRRTGSELMVAPQSVVLRGLSAQPQPMHSTRSGNGLAGVVSVGFAQVGMSVACVWSCLLLIAGCGTDSTYPIVPAVGVVKYDDGSLIPAHRISVKFLSQSPPIDLKTHPRPGLGEVNIEDGTIVVSTYGFADGLIRGKHKVTVQSLDEKNRLTPAVPQLYRLPRSSPLEIDTESGPFELVIKKP